ncbi:short-chain dehydrogenase/reductase SDR [Ephemerocybe angulata]|uniref:Short-chain dehydrogenase/reductase SDR n=1 Tax=Ephemerocybe angulata TaxID=980116 RepID=A0A8H6I6Q5_9AGAR|nr:short-chain dehydrogenase/reductase SDR [Tulosesus angulatus]
MSRVLEGKAAIITGASSGIGLATVKLFVDSGATVLGVDLSPAPSAVPLGENFQFHQVNLTEPSAASSIIAAFTSAFPSKDNIDILVNNAGIMDNNEGVDTLTDDVYQRVIAVNLTSPIKLMGEVVKIMKQNGGGSIVNVSSKAGSSGASAGVAYTASKHGLLGATKNTAWLYKEDSIRCNAISPGAVRTNIANSMDMASMDLCSSMKIAPVIACHVNTQTGAGTAGPEVAAQAILFLASDLSKGITGAVLPVDNGWSVI